MTWIDAVQDYLATAGIGTTGVDWFQGDLPDDPPAAAMVNDYGGSPGELTHDAPGVAYEHPRFQVSARAASNMDGDQRAARARVQLAYDRLTTVQNQTIGGIRFVGIDALGPVFRMGRDDEGRPLFAANFEAYKEPSA